LRLLVVIKFNVDLSHISVIKISQLK